MASTPTTGVHFTETEIQQILSSLSPPLQLSTWEDTALGYNNRVYFLSTTCGRQLVLKAGGRYWERQKTEAEIAGLLFLARNPRDILITPGITGFDSHPVATTGRWEWILLERLHGSALNEVWNTLTQIQKENVTRKLADIIIHLQSISPAPGIHNAMKYGNLSLTQPEEDDISIGHDHASIDISPSSTQPIYISRILNGPPASTTYRDYVASLLTKEIGELERSEHRLRLPYCLFCERIPRLRRLAEKLHDNPPPLIRLMSGNPRWKAVFTHGDFRPQNILVCVPGATGTIDYPSEHDLAIAVLDWEWSGFFPPQIEWDAGLNTMVELFPTDAKKIFLDALQGANVMTPESAPKEEWKVATNLSRLTECVYPWWLATYPERLGEEEQVREGRKRDKVILELDHLLDFFEAL